VADRAGKDGSGGKLPQEERTAHPPNVILAHLEEGIEAVHLYSGRTICKLHLAPRGMHTDLNADGVLDHVQVMTSTPSSINDFFATVRLPPDLADWTNTLRGDQFFI